MASSTNKVHDPSAGAIDDAATTVATTTSFTEELRCAAGDGWNRVIHHRFTTELASNTIPHNTVLRRYLIQDYRFLDSFVVLLASVIAKCRTLQDRIPACQFLAKITSQENTYFERCFHKLPHCTLRDREKIPNASCTTQFCNLMTNVAHYGTLGEMLSVLVVCEWSYLEWGQRVLPNTVRNDNNFCTYEWVDLHSGVEFEKVVLYLRQLLDQEGQRMTIDEKQKCTERFLQAVQLEEDFFDYAYNSTD